jgi:cobalt-zinc-cadmium resistance protein CzcA
VQSLGLEFLPKLEEGNLWIRATMPTSISLEAGSPTVDGIRKQLKSYPEVITVISQHGRPDDGTDATGFFNAEFFVPLKPFDTWPDGVDKEKLTTQMTEALTTKFPGVDFNFSQYIEDNVEEALSGVKGELAIKLFGDNLKMLQEQGDKIEDNVEEAASGVKGENSVKLYGGDLEVLERTANKMKDVMASVPGITDLAVLSSLGQPTVRIDVDRVRAARYGLAPGDVNTTVQAAIGGQAAGAVYEEGSDRNFPIIVRLAPEYRQTLASIRRIMIGATNPNGGVVQVPLSDVASVKLVSGASFIYREGQERYIPIKFSVRGRDLGTVVLEAQQKVAQQVLMPGGYHTEWVGEFGNLQEALTRLAIVVPLSILLICFLLYINFGSLIDMLLSASVIPMALIGGIAALYATGTPFSVSAAIGFVALFGISAMDGILIVTYFNRMIADGMERSEAVLRTCLVCGGGQRVDLSVAWYNTICLVTKSEILILIEQHERLPMAQTQSERIVSIQMSVLINVLSEKVIGWPFLTRFSRLWLGRKADLTPTRKMPVTGQVGASGPVRSMVRIGGSLRRHFPMKTSAISV